MGGTQIKKQRQSVQHVVNKEERLIEWAGQNPYLKDKIKMNWLAEHNGSCSITPTSGDISVETYIDGSRLKHYDFIFQAAFDISDADDDINTANMFELRLWQHWIDEMEKAGNYPDFGESCANYELQNLSNSPQLAQSYGNGAAKYQFPARLIYTEQ